MFRTHHLETNAWKGLLSGVAAGLAGTLAMTASQRLWSAAQRRLTQGGDGSGDAEGDGSDGGEPATVEAAQRVSRRVLGRELMPWEKERAGQAVHYGFGTSVGGAYGLLAEYAPAATAGLGVPFGVVLMLLADEVAVPALRLSGPPTEQPPSTHAYALAAHAVYGLAVESVRRSLRARL